MPGQSGLNFLLTIYRKPYSEKPVARLFCYGKLYFIDYIYKF